MTLMAVMCQDGLNIMDKLINNNQQTGIDGKKQACLTETLPAHQVSSNIRRSRYGGVLGLIFSLSVSIGFLSSNLLGFFLYTVAGVLYGIFIEWLSTDVFKAPMKAT